MDNLEIQVELGSLYLVPGEKERGMWGEDVGQQEKCLGLEHECVHFPLSIALPSYIA